MHSGVKGTHQKYCNLIHHKREKRFDLFTPKVGFELWIERICLYKVRFTYWKSKIICWRINYWYFLWPFIAKYFLGKTSIFSHDVSFHLFIFFIVFFSCGTQFLKQRFQKQFYNFDPPPPQISFGSFSTSIFCFFDPKDGLLERKNLGKESKQHIKRTKFHLSCVKRFGNRFGCGEGASPYKATGPLVF